MPPSKIARTADQYAVFGRFCANAGSFPSPRKIEQRIEDDHQIYHFRRRFYGFDSPITCALVEPLPTAGAQDRWRAAEAVLKCLADRRPPEIVKLFIAETAGAGKDGDSILKRNIAGAYHGVFFPHPDGEAIELPEIFEAFLKTLGNHTRRDVRRYRRKADASGTVFEFKTASADGAAERHAVGRRTRPKRLAPRLIDAYDRFIVAQAGSFHATLRGASGELLSCCAGFCVDNLAFLLYQLNDSARPKAALSLTNRGHLIEHLIKDGMRELICPGGIVGLLAPACKIRHGGELILIRRSPLAMAKALAIGVLRPDSYVGWALRRILRDGL